MAEWVRVASLEDLPTDTLKAVGANGARIVLANAEGDIYALEDRCSHQDFPLSDGELEGTSLECIYHGAAFDVCSGRALQLPALRPVKAFEVEVREGEVYVQVND